MKTADLRFGTIVQVRGGRIGTVVYKGFDGYGVAWGEIPLTEADRAAAEKIEGHRLPPVEPGRFPIPGADALLREHFPGAGMPCAGQACRVIRQQFPAEPEQPTITTSMSEYSSDA
jgi:hypothetical protein